MSIPVQVSGAIAIACTGYVIYRRVSKNSRLPPSPPSDPFIDHALRFPVVHPWLTFTEWGKKYGKQLCFVNYSTEHAYDDPP